MKIKTRQGFIGPPNQKNPKKCGIHPKPEIFPAPYVNADYKGKWKSNRKKVLHIVTEKV